MSDFLHTPVRQASVVDEVDHRPWPLPEGPWVQAQTWEDLCFLHWRVDAAVLRGLVPAGLELDTHDGAAWLGIVPFRLSGLRLRGLPPLPFVSSFPELNVRTYVTRDDKPGIWFFSLDAASRLAVEGARRLYKLPYFEARMTVGRRAGWVHYESARAGSVFSARYRGTGVGSTEPAESGAGSAAARRETRDFFRPEPGSLAWFLTERYCLYAEGEGGELHRAEIHHPPWPLQAAEAEIELNTMAPPGLQLPDEPPLAHFAARQDVVVWGLDRVTH